MSEELDETLSDKLTAIVTILAKNTASLLNPTFGPLIGEIVGTLIPNQRINRIAKFVKQLDSKLSLIPIERLNNLLQNEELIDLLEDGFMQASRASSDERREYISQIIINGIDEEAIKYSESRTMLQLLQEITDVEVIWLRYYANYYTEDFRAFGELHKDVLSNVIVATNADEETYRKQALQEYCCQHLERIGLLGLDYSVNNHKLNQFIGDRAMVTPKGYSITRLGLILLKQLGLVTSISKRHLNR